MRVILDVAVLGVNHRHPKHWKSISRVAEQHARALAGAEDIETILRSTLGVENLRCARRYLAERGLGDLGRRHRRPAEAVFPWRDRLWAEPLPPSALRRLGRAAGREALRFLLKKAARVLPAVTRRDLREAQAYHTPFCPFPRRILKDRRIAHFFTVHDLFGLTRQGFYPDEVVEEGRRWVAALQPSDWVFCVSGHTRQELLGLRPDLDPSRLRVTHLGVDAAFRPCGDEDRLRRVRARYGIPLGVPYVLSLAQMDFRKNTGRLMRAFVRVVEQEHIPDLRLVLAGGFWQAESAVRRDWEALGPLRDRVHFIGWVEEEDLSPLYSGAEAFAFPSLAEGFGLPPLEAMRCGVPVVTGNATSLPEVVGDAALTVDPTDEDALAQALLDLHRTPTLREDLARRGLARSTTFTWESFGEKCLAAYREAGAGVS